MSSGIYKITDKINNKVYIGCSKNIEHRWVAHKSESILEQYPPYHYSIHKAFRKYGIDNFNFEIIEIVNDETQLFTREKYWIKYYDSYRNGYNETEGGDSGPSLPLESNPNSKLKNEDIIYIRTLQLEGKMPSEVYSLFSNKISRRGFDHIWRGENWKELMPEAIEYFHSKKYKTATKKFARENQISKDKKQIYKDIKEKKQKGLKRMDVYEEYKNIYSLSGFNKVWYR